MQLPHLGDVQQVSANKDSCETINQRAILLYRLGTIALKAQECVAIPGVTVLVIGLAMKPYSPVTCDIKL